MTDYNELGVQYEGAWQQAGFVVSGYMPDPVTLEKVNLYNTINAEASDEDKHPQLKGYLGVLHHLDAFLVSVERIVEMFRHIQAGILSPELDIRFPILIVKRSGYTGPRVSPPLLMGISSKLIEIESETLLLRAVSLLERITKLIANECNLERRLNFYHLERALQSGGGVRCVELLRVLQEVMPRLVKTVISHDNETSLRNIIAHRASSPEILEAGFSLNWPEQDTLLAFDVEIGGFPLIGTIRELAGAIPYYIMDSLRVLLGASAEDCKLRDWSDRVAFTEADFEPVWVNPFIHYSSYIDPDKNGPIVSIVRWTPGGFRPHQQHLKEEVFDLAVSPTPAEQQTP